MTGCQRHHRLGHEGAQRWRSAVPRVAAHVVAGLVLAIALPAASAGVLSADLERAMAARGTHADTAVIVRFDEPVDLQPLVVADRSARDSRLLVALKTRAAQKRAAIEPLLVARGAQRIRDLWIINGLAATLPAVAVKQLAAASGIERIELDSFVQGGRSQRLPAPRAPYRGAVPPLPQPSAAAEDPGEVLRAAPGWNIAAVRAPQLWALGHTGRGVVVASLDTGVDLAHADLQRKWRGGTNSWFDPHGEEATPYDALGHGTQAMGVMVGGRALGVAPAARWIAVRLYDSAGRARMSDIHLAFQWLLDPDGDPATADAPDIVNASWTLAGRPPGSCIAEFSDDIRVLRSSGIVVVFAAGNEGPAGRTSSSPANNPGALSVGAVDRDLGLARQSSRGPSSCDGGVFPQLVAPGMNVRTTDLSHGGPPAYANVSGTSVASPHAAGVLALLMSAFPSASVAELEGALTRGAQDLGDAGPDNRYGHGLVDAVGAFDWLRHQRGAAAPVGAARPTPAPSAPLAESQSGRDGPSRYGTSQEMRN